MNLDNEENSRLASAKFDVIKSAMEHYRATHPFDGQAPIIGVICLTHHQLMNSVFQLMAFEDLLSKRHGP